jgi:hypothetical protein
MNYVAAARVGAIETPASESDLVVYVTLSGWQIQALRFHRPSISR